MAAFPRSKGSMGVGTRGQQSCESYVVPFSVQGRKYEDPMSAYDRVFEYLSKHWKLHDKKWDDQSNIWRQADRRQDALRVTYFPLPSGKGSDKNCVFSIEAQEGPIFGGIHLPGIGLSLVIRLLYTMTIK